MWKVGVDCEKDKLKGKLQLKKIILVKVCVNFQTFIFIFEHKKMN